MSFPVPSLLRFLAVLLLAPLLPALINRVKAVVAGRRGAPLLQGYYDLWKLLGKSAVYSRTTGWVFRAGPIAGLAAALVALAILPWGGGSGLLSFEGDLFLFAYLFALMRFLTILAALDTGSSFEAMGASREAWFSALAEPALLLSLAALARSAGVQPARLAALLAGPRLADPAVPLAAAALFIVFLAENSRIPVDDPDTHLELTMIHEVMVLDHGGPDLAFVQYGAALKLWIFGSLVAGLFTPGAAALVAPRGGLPEALFALAGLALLGLATGLLESLTARLRLQRVPQLLVSASAMAALAVVLELVR